MSATVVWDQPDRAVFFKPPGWEVYGAHTNRQMPLNCSGCSGSLFCHDILEDCCMLRVSERTCKAYPHPYMRVSICWYAIGRDGDVCACVYI